MAALEIPHQSIYIESTDEIKRLHDFYSKNLNYKIINNKFNIFIKDSPLINGKTFTYNNDNLAAVFYRDYYQLFYTKYQYKELFNLIESKKKIIIRTGDPYLRRLLIGYKKAGYKNIKIHRHNLYRFSVLITDLLKIFLNLYTFIRHPFFIFFKKKCLVHTSNNFGPNTKYDYRIAPVIKKIDENNIPQLFLIRTTHSPLKIIKNHFARDHICIYTDSIIKIANMAGIIRNFISFNGTKTSFDTIIFQKLNHGIYPIIYSINILKFFLKMFKSNTAFISDNSERSIIELVASNQLKINTIGIQMGVELYFYHGHKFAHGMEKRLKFMAHNKFGVWSKGWESYFIKHSKVFEKNNIFIAGFHRNVARREKNNLKKNNVKKVLWLCENLTPVEEIVEYIGALLKNDFDLCIKARPQQKDAGDNVASELIEYFGKDKFTVITDPIEICASDYDLAIGSYTTALLDCGLMGVPVLIIKNNTWEDIFDLQDNPILAPVYAKDSSDLISKINNLPIQSISLFLEEYAPDYRLNGSDWVLEELQKSFENKLV
tara:strand:- start:9902 stop:11536 length:1635 start_codon:yes stop_codon:yes gene_type:complete